MFNRRRNVGLYYALGIAGIAVLAGAGTFLLVTTRRRNTRMREMSAQAKRVIQRTASTIHHAKRSRSNGHAKGHHIARP